MDKKKFDERVSRLSEVSKVIEGLPTEIRAPAFSLLADYIIQQPMGEKAGAGGKPDQREAANDLEKEDFFRSFDHSKPADNVYLITAYLYREYGTAPFSIKELQEASDEVGVTLPGRIDMTLKAATAKGKNLYTSTGRGLYKPTVHGEAFLKETYNVRKGNKARA